jgi:outer membrane protein OmpA-like peptidoglycan-associated protein
MLRVLIILFVLALTTNCMTYDPYTEEKQVSKSTAGGAIGAVAGAILGNQVKGSKQARQNSRIAGALIGGAIGAGFGNNLDKQEARLRRKLRSTGVQIVRKGKVLHLIMPGDITFRSGMAVIQPSFYSVLDSVVEVLKEYDKSYIEIAGHTDYIGSDISNQILSQQRADSVSSYFASKGIARRRIDTVGYGESRPLGDNYTAAGRRQNRRVEISLTN